MELCDLKDNSETNTRADRQNASVRLVLLYPPPPTPTLQARPEPPTTLKPPPPPLTPPPPTLHPTSAGRRSGMPGHDGRPA